jgi:hypothetical protein
MTPLNLPLVIVTVLPSGSDPINSTSTLKIAKTGFPTKVRNPAHQINP